MSAEDFRGIALALPETVEGAHMGHADFRVRGKIFATLGYPDAGWGMVKLRPDQQEIMVAAEPGIFQPVKGGWGRRGSTNVRLETADEDTLKSALAAAWRNVAPAALAKETRIP